jgi:hypothetical protein
LLGRGAHAAGVRKDERDPEMTPDSVGDVGLLSRRIVHSRNNTGTRILNP